MGYINIWKYREDSGELKFYFDNSGLVTELPTFRDKIKIDSIPAGAVDYIDYRVENKNGMLNYAFGDSVLKLPYDDNYTSFTGKNLYDFFNDGYTSKFLVLVYYNDYFNFAGTFTSGEVTENLSYHKQQPECEIHFKHILKEFAETMSLSHKGTRVVDSYTDIYSLESYIEWHFDENYLLNYQRGEDYYVEKCGDFSMKFSGNMQKFCNNFGANFNSIPRWQTFSELRQEIGFDIQLLCTQPAIAYIQTHPKFTLKLEWVDEIENRTPLTVDVLDWKRETRIDNRKWFFYGNRHISRFNNDNSLRLTSIQGVMFSSNETIVIDENNTSGDYKEFQIWADGTYNNNQIVYSEPRVFTDRFFTRETEIIEAGVTLYTNPTFEKFKQGTMSYGSFMVGDGYNHLPVLNYIANRYRKYLISDKDIQNLEIFFDGSQELQLFRYIPLTINGELRKYYLYSVNDINTEENRADISVMRI